MNISVIRPFFSSHKGTDDTRQGHIPKANPDLQVKDVQLGDTFAARTTTQALANIPTHQADKFTVRDLGNGQYQVVAKNS